MNETRLQLLQTQADALQAISIADLFAEDTTRFASFHAKFDDLLIDFSRERITKDIWHHLLQLADDHNVLDKAHAMRNGAIVNDTEQRPALHMALRGSCDDNLCIDGENISMLVADTTNAMLDFADNVRRGRICAAGGTHFTDVVNIGIGGSDLGAAMVVDALGSDSLACHFLANIDGNEWLRIAKNCNPETTLVIVSSKTFTTTETLTNAETVRCWLQDTVGDGWQQHMVGVSTNAQAMKDFGILPKQQFLFWNWVGGRYSVFSAVGLTIALAIGSSGFRSFLQGAAVMDAHFLHAPTHENLPLILALIGIWRRNFLHYPTLALIPYDTRLRRFYAYIQQLDMESNGKNVRHDHHPTPHASAPVIWGDAGTNAQHSFFQMLHQGTDIVPTDFIICVDAGHELADHHHHLLANAIAQAQALALGRTDAHDLPAYRQFVGNRPSTIICHDHLDAFTLGRLIALFEHKIFALAMIWEINPFDQWGVELGKEMAGPLAQSIQNRDDGSDFPVSQGILQWLRTRKEQT
ncbi:MAG: glucose-6-phosphate isomerase [Pseudomonadota bacterium]